MSTKRICHITTDHGPFDPRIFEKECITLSRHGYEVYLVQPHIEGAFSGVQLVKYNMRRTSMRLFWFLRHSQAYEKALALNCDIYHFHDPSFFYFAKKLKKAGKRVIYDCHETKYSDICADYARNQSRLADLLRKRYDLYEQFISRKVDEVIVVTPQMVDYMRRYNKNVTLLTNYPVKRDIQHIGDNCQVIFAGGIKKLWNHEYIIDAISTIDNMTYCLCGSGSLDYIEKLKGHSGWNKVKYCGAVSHENVIKLLSESMIGIAISSYRKNTFGKEGTMGNTKIFEEMQAGLPVVCTDFILWQKIVNKYKCGICVSPHSVEEIRDAIEYLVDHPEEAKAMGKRGKEAVDQVFNWENEEPKLLELYDRLCKSAH